MSTSDPSGSTVEQLYREMTAGDSLDDDPLSSPNHLSEELVASVTERLFPDESFRFDDELVKNSLEELLLVLVALREGEAHGKGLMDDLAQLFDAQLSPGTVYPRLHELEDEEILRIQELVRTKEYQVDDHEALRERVEAAMIQHLALGLVFRSALEEL